MGEIGFTDGYDDRISVIENQFLQDIFACETPMAVEAAVTYASFLNKLGLTPENYPVFLRMLEIENHWVIDALIGDAEPTELLSCVQPNEYIVGRILAMVRRWKRGGIPAKNLAVILGVLKLVYRAPHEGFALRRLAPLDVNAIAKHLDKSKGQDDPVNRAILDLLDPISRASERGDSDHNAVAAQAIAVKSAFLDDRKDLEDVIPADLLAASDPRLEIAPRTRAAFSVS